VTFAVTVRDATSTIDTSFDGLFAVNTVLPSSDTAMPHGRNEQATGRWPGVAVDGREEEPGMTRTSVRRLVMLLEQGVGILGHFGSNLRNSED
jgi:hypothetical protein